MMVFFNPFFRQSYFEYETGSDFSRKDDDVCYHLKGILSEGLSTSSPLNRELYLPLTKYKDGLQSRMRDAQMETHTVRSHGATLARTHRHDWLILILLMALVVMLNLIHPFKRFVGKDMMDDLRYPLKDNTIPVWAVPVYAVLLPIVVFLFFYSRIHDVYDLHHAILGILYSVLVTGVITDAIKVAVGRPRPDFFWRCFPDGKDAYDHWGNVICHGAKNVLKEGYKSFPSGHTSWSFAGLGFLSLYLAGKIRAFDSRGHVAKLCVVFLPLIAACLVAISRVDDYWHHWQDVFAGGLIGLVVASFCYLQFFPPPYHMDGWATYAYFRIVQESRAHVQSNLEIDRNNSQNLDDRSANERNNSAVREVSPEVEDVESGRR